MQPIKFQPGTIKDPQHTESSDYSFYDTDKVHFPDGDLTTIPGNALTGFSRGNTSTIEGTGRAIWTSRIVAGGRPVDMIATHRAVYAIIAEALYNITPMKGARSYDLASSPLSVTSGSPTLTVSAPAHGLSVGDYATIAFASDLGGVDAETYINIEHNVASVVDADSFTVTLAVNAASTATGGGTIATLSTIPVLTTLAGALSTTIGSATVTIDYPSHGFIGGERIRITGATDIGGITALSLNKYHVVEVVDTDTLSFITSTEAASTATGGGTISLSKQINAGAEIQELGSGFGYGTLGFGILGNAFVSDSEQSFPRISSFNNFGNDILYCPGDYVAGDGQKIYIFSGDPNIGFQTLTNAPENCNWVTVVNNSVVAACGRNLRIGETGNATVWDGVTTSEFPLQRIVRISSIKPVGDKAAIVFAPAPYYLTSVTGDWDLTELGAEYPVIAPNAASPFLGGLIWMDENSRLCYFNGSSVEIVINRQNGEYIRKNINNAARWTVFAFQDPKHKQVWFYYPSSGNDNPDSYVIYNPESQSFTLGLQSRTAAQQPYMVDSGFLMIDSDILYSHFTGQPTDFNWYAESAFFSLDNGASRFRINSLMVNCSGSADITLSGKENYLAPAVRFNTEPTSPNRISARGAGRLISIEYAGSSDFTLKQTMIEAVRQGKGI